MRRKLLVILLALVLSSAAGMVRVKTTYAFSYYPWEHPVFATPVHWNYSQSDIDRACILQTRELAREGYTGAWELERGYFPQDHWIPLDGVWWIWGDMRTWNCVWNR